MEFSSTLSGSAMLMKKFQIAVTPTAVGQPWLIPAANTAGLAIATTTGAVDMVGVNIDTTLPTYVTAQQTDGTSARRTITVIINPDAVWKIKMSGGATENTALSLQTVTTAMTDGLSVTTAAEWSNPTYDEGFVWAFDGVNASGGLTTTYSQFNGARKITAVSSTAATVTVAFDRLSPVGDNFLRCPYSPMQGTKIQLSTLLTQADASIAVGTGAEFRPIELLLNDQTDQGRSNSFVYAVSNSHALRLA